STGQVENNLAATGRSCTRNNQPKRRPNQFRSPRRQAAGGDQTRTRDKDLYLQRGQRSWGTQRKPKPTRLRAVPAANECEQFRRPVNKNLQRSTTAPPRCQ